MQFKFGKRFVISFLLAFFKLREQEIIIKNVPYG